MSFCRYTIQGSFTCNTFSLKNSFNTIETFKEGGIAEMPQPEWVVKNQCKACEDCPSGTYCQTCKECKMLNMTYGDKHVKLLQCDCPRSLVDSTYNKTVLGIDDQYCNTQKTQDISNCGGNLKCGVCSSKTGVYST